MSNIPQWAEMTLPKATFVERHICWRVGHTTRGGFPPMERLVGIELQPWRCGRCRQEFVPRDPSGRLPRHWWEHVLPRAIWTRWTIPRNP